MAMQGLKTVTQLDKAIKETTKTTPYSIAGYSGLFLSVEVSKYTGKKTAIFKHRYSHPILKGKRPTITLGQYPTFTLEQARQAYNDNLALLGRDIDPIEHRQDEKQREIADRKNTLQIFIDEWLSDLKVNNVNQKTLKNYTEWLSPIQSQFSQTRVTDIKPSDVIQFIKAIQKTHPAKGLRVKSVFKSVLQIAKAYGIIEYNPADNLKGTLITHTPKHQNAIITLTDLNKLLNDIALLPESPLFQKEILQLLALTFVRINDLCAMKWSDIDMTAKTWTFEPQKGVDRSDMVDCLIIPLAPQAIAILESMKAKTGGHEYVFYNPRRKEHKHTHKQEINKILNSPAMNDGLGYKGIHSPHGFRATARTMLEERLDFDYRLIEMQLGHNVRDSNRRAYNRVKWLNQRTQMMKEWANYLDDLRAGKIDNVIYLDKVKAKAMNE